MSLLSLTLAHCHKELFCFDSSDNTLIYAEIYNSKLYNSYVASYYHGSPPWRE